MQAINLLQLPDPATTARQGQQQLQLQGQAWSEPLDIRLGPAMAWFTENKILNVLMKSDANLYAYWMKC